MGQVVQNNTGQMKKMLGVLPLIMKWQGQRTNWIQQLLSHTEASNLITPHYSYLYSYADLQQIGRSTFIKY